METSSDRTAETVPPCRPLEAGLLLTLRNRVFAWVQRSRVETTGARPTQQRGPRGKDASYQAKAELASAEVGDVNVACLILDADP